jgi:hypothetical protein
MKKAKGVAIITLKKVDAEKKGKCSKRKKCVDGH